MNAVWRQRVRLTARPLSDADREQRERRCHQRDRRDRRERRRVDVRTELRTAHELFSDFGMEAFAERARVELEATGEHVQTRSTDSLGQLTPQEAQISRLVAQDLTNKEIAAQLFISPSTVEYHLKKVFRKLDVTSRTQLARAVDGREPPRGRV